MASLTDEQRQLCLKLGTKVRQLMFPVPPDVLHWVQLKRVGRQIYQADRSLLAAHKL
jgi:hypothetical protein